MLCSVRKKNRRIIHTCLLLQKLIGRINQKLIFKWSSIGREEKSGRRDKEGRKTSLTLHLFIILIFFTPVFSIIQKIKLTEKGKKLNIQFKTTQSKLKYISNF